MAFSDWTVEIIDVLPSKNTTLNPYTSLPIDPDGITQSLFKMRLTHVPSGKVLDRADLIGTLSEEFLKNYARSVTANAETHMANQKKADGTPSPFKGTLDITLPTQAAPSADDVAVAAFSTLVQSLQQSKARLAIKKGAQGDVDAAEAAVKDAYTDKGVPVSSARAKRFDEVLESALRSGL